MATSQVKLVVRDAVDLVVRFSRSPQLMNSSGVSRAQLGVVVSDQAIWALCADAASQNLKVEAIPSDGYNEVSTQMERQPCANSLSSF
jgi:hypothetical protein